MNTMLVSPLFKVSPDGPVSTKGGALVHLRQGELDGACGPYCLVSGLITLGLMGRDDVMRNMHSWKGSSRHGRFRDALYAFGTFTSEGTFGGDLLWLTDFYKRAGLQACHIEGNKQQVFERLAVGIESGELPIVGVQWAGGGAHWMLVVGYQGTETDGDFQLTHLLCLDPGQEGPRASLWNAVVEVLDGTGASVNKGRMSSNFWGMDGNLVKCQIKDAVILTFAPKA
ncbi:hypothetical protein [Stutzerimonas chloritidismutans]|uniref:hypothetical protein n=1 Tax=Stutzerimonas chloritidismutans TaxID=203192 RepID=UPI0038502E7A